MEWNKQKIKGLLLVVCGGVAFYCALQRLDAVLAALGWLLGILAPFLLGGALAFILNVPMRAIERHLFPRNRKGAKLRRPLALVLTLVAVIGVLALAGLVIGPGIADAVMSIIREIPAAFQRLEHQLTALAENLQDLWPLLEEQLMKLQEEIQWQELSAKALEIAKAIGAGIVSSGGFIGGVVSGVSTFVISLIFSFYVLLQKEKLGRQGRQVIYGLLPLRQADRTLDVLRLSGRTFSSFLSGQCLEACILGTLFVAAMTIFRMPYALLVGVLIALTALIPIVGAFIGCAVGALLIAIDDPWKALWFIVLFLVLQQIEGNLIYPHVVGSSVGLPSIWVLAAVTLGGKLMGITGMLFFIPLCSVIYALFRSYVKNRLVSKAVPPEKWRDRLPHPPGSERSFRRPTSVQKPAVQIGRPVFVRRFNFLLTRILVSAMLYLTRIIVILTWIIVRKGDERMPLYNRLKEHRARLGVNQQEMGALAGVSRQTISQIERGGYSPSVTLALKLARICGVTVEDIFTYQEDECHER